MARVYFGYIQDKYPAYRWNNIVGQGTNLFIEFLKKELKWQKHYNKGEFKEEFFDISTVALPELWKKFEKSGIRFKTGLVSTQSNALKPHEATIQVIEVAKLPIHIRHWLRGY